MQTSNAKKNSGSDVPVWVLLAEFSLQDFLSDLDQRDKPAAASLLQVLRELGMSPKYMENIARALAGFAKEAVEHDRYERREFPGRIRLFCQKKILDDLNPAKTFAPYHTTQNKKHTQNIPDSSTNMIGGWGYFMIERGEDLPSSSAMPQTYVDLYIYKECYLNADYK